MNDTLVKKLNQIKQNTKLNNNQKLTKIAYVVDGTYDNVLKNCFYNLILNKHIDTKDYTSADSSIRANAIDDPKKSQQESKISKYLSFSKSAKLGNFTYLNNPTKLITSKDLNHILAGLLSTVKDYHVKISNSKIYDIYTVNNDGTLTDTTYKVITSNLIKRIEKQFMHYEHVLLVPSGCDDHTHFEYHWLKDLFDMGMTIDCDNAGTYTQKAESILSDMIDTTENDDIKSYRKELLKPVITIKRKKDLLFASALAFAEQILYEEY